MPGLVVFLLAFGRSMADGVGLTDESWFLQVVARMRDGDVLYRDVFLGVTPLSAYVTSALTHVTGIEVVAVKIVTNACFAVTVVLAGRFARLAGLSDKASWLVMAAMFVWARPYSNPPYTPMAMLFFMAAAVASLSTAGTQRRMTESLPGWLGAGALAGLAFAAKQNVGLLALGAVGCALVVDARRTGGSTATAAARAFLGFAAAAGVVLVPVALSGGLPALWDYGFSGKGAYLDIGAVSYLASVGALVTPIVDGPSMAGLSDALHALVVVLPLAVLATALAAARRLERNDWVLLAFVVAATFVAFPRWDRFHMAYAVPVHLVALGRLLPRMLFGRSGDALGHAGAWAVVALAVVVAAQPIAIAARGDREPFTQRHFRGPLMRPPEADLLEAQALRLREAAAGNPVFVVRADAGFWYLASGTRNPTPFDMPARTATGSNGITELLAQLNAGAITHVCLESRRQAPQSLVEVEQFVRTRYEAGVDVGPCTIFTGSSPTAPEQTPS